MKIYVADSSRLQAFSLTSNIKDSYIINYKSPDDIEETIALVYQDNYWKISLSSDMIVYNKNVPVTDEAIFKDNNSFSIKFNDLKERIFIYYHETPTKFNYYLNNQSSITLGNAQTNLIKINDDSIGTYKIYISQNSGYWFLQESYSIEEKIYVNRKSSSLSSLKIGDVIFFKGIIIIWLGNFCKIIDNRNVTITLERYNITKNDNKYTPVNEDEKSITLYNENQVFFHSPRIKNSIVKKEIIIESPPDKREGEDQPLILTLGSSITSGVSSTIAAIIAIVTLSKEPGNKMSIISQTVICISVIIGTLIIPFASSMYRKSKIKKYETKRQEKYLAYLASKREEINNELINQKKILKENFLSYEECKNAIKTSDSKVWSKEINDSEFLTFAVGTGNRAAEISVKAEIKEFTLEDDNLKNEVSNILNTPLILDDVPITISLTTNKVFPIIIDKSFAYKKQFIDSLILQIMTYYSGIDLKVVVFTDNINSEEWDYLKFLPYCYSRDKKTHFFATNIEEMKSISTYLEGIYSERKNSIASSSDEKVSEEEITDKEIKYLNFSEYYLIITDDYVNAKRIKIIDTIINSSLNIGFSLLTIENSMKNVPSKIEQYAYLSKDETTLYNSKDSQLKKNFVFNLPETNIITESLVIANKPIPFEGKGNKIPNVVGFLEMYKVGTVEQLNIISRWKNSDPTLSLSTPLGIDENGNTLYLDLHEKSQGPHGLIAGSTGSGKSEFIITFILSMAVSYSPYEVQFVLIDYKGGGLAGAFENKEKKIKIPHLVGTITNLDTSEMNRTLVSIRSELKRRQRLFNQARDKLGESTVDIYKYQRFFREKKVDEPISHLFIISDEFAELKAQQPDFMNELVSTARIGRSLGVHLVLCTQKPAGIVDEQIWSNARFKICLKVQTPEDSMELLKRPEAANIKGLGRFYLQIGYNESFELAQSAWSGMKYIPAERMIKEIDDSILFVSNTGEVLRETKDTQKKENSIDLGDQLTNVVKHLSDIAERDHLDFKQLWLPSLPDKIYITNLVKKYNYKAEPYLINPIIGEYDIPEEQLQKLLTIDFTNTGNLIIYGKPGCGKENLLMTLIYSICMYHSPSEVNFYLLDFGAEILKIFSNFPHVGDVILADESSKVKSEFEMLEKEINRRKELFVDYGGSYQTYIKESNEKLPLIVTVLNSFEGFAENCEGESEFLGHILRDSSMYGIVFIMTANAVNSVYVRISQCFENKIALQLTDDYDYRYTFGAPMGLIPAPYFGRGIISMGTTAYEFQTAYIYYKEKIDTIIRSAADKLNEVYKTKAKTIPIIPKVLDAEYMLSYIENIENLPIGVNNYDATIHHFNFNQSNKMLAILGNSIILKNDFVCELIKAIDYIPNVKLRVFDIANALMNIDPSIEYYTDNFTYNISNIKNNILETKMLSVYIFFGIGYMYDKILDEGIEELNNTLNSELSLTNSCFIFIDNYNTFKLIENESWYSKISNKDGIWVGKGIANQKIFNIDNLKESDAEMLLEGIIYPIENGKYDVVKGMLPDRGDEFE